VKKVRYAIGAVGVIPALGLMAPAANAAAAAPRVAGGASKTVALERGNAPLYSCGHGHTKYAQNGSLGGEIGYSGTTCIHSQWAELDHFQKGLTERVRFYSGAGTLETTNWQAGHDIDNQYTFFSSVPNLNAHKVCEALVANSNHSDVKYGPVCETA
jgi:hypothetical protein